MQNGLKQQATCYAELKKQNTCYMQNGLKQQATCSETTANMLCRTENNRQQWAKLERTS